jgi:uncharacterized protein YrrD
MLRLSETYLNQPVMSLRTGGMIATTVEAIINPNNLKVEGFFCQDSLEKKKQLILLEQDIRDILAQGIVVNDHEVLSELSDLPRLREIINLNFVLVGKQVITVSKKVVGKVTDYSIDSKSMFIQKLYVSPPIMRNLTGKGLMVDRTQINEITNKQIIINDLEGTVPAQATATA